MIKIVNLNKKYDELVIFENVSINFPSKGLCFISAPSGKGKTTLLNILSLMDDDYSGDVYINETNYKDIRKQEEFRGNNFAYVFQENDLFNELSIKDNLCIDKEVDVKNVLKKVRLNADETRVVNTLSQGEYKRVSLARAILNDAKVIFVDEITSSLDDDNKKIVMEIIKEISKEILVIYVSHDRELINTYGDYIYKIENKKILNNGEVFASKIQLIEKEKKLSLPYKFIYSTTLLKNKKIRSFMVILTLVISILSFSITSLLVNVIGTELKTSISSLVDSSLGIARLDDEIKINEITSVSFEDINMIKNKYPMLIDYIGTYYYSNFEEQMIDKNQFYLDLNDYHYVINHMSLRSINDYIIDDNYSLNNDEIVLGIDSKTLYDISARLNISNDINVLKRYLINNNVEGVFSFINLSWEYYKDLNLNIKDLVLNDKNCIIHSSYFWNEYVFESELRLVPSYELNASNRLPWMIKKAYYIKTDFEKTIEILDVLLQDENFFNIWFDYLEIPPIDLTYSKFDGLTGRIIATYQSKKRINYNILNDFNTMTLSIPKVYFIVDSLMLHSFSNATFLLPNYDDFKYIEGEYNVSKYNLNKEEIHFHSNILNGSIKNIGDSDNLIFLTEKPHLILGREPLNIEEIVISKKAAKKMFNVDKLDSLINKTAYFLTVKNIYSLDELYHHQFAMHPIKIVGISNDDKNDVIYQNTNWITHFYSYCLNYSLSDLYIDGLIIKEQNNEMFNDEKNLGKYPYLNFKNPSFEFKKSIDDTLLIMEYGLISLGLIQGVLSLISLSVVIYLFIVENKREIGLFYVLGYDENNIRSLFRILCFTTVMIAFLYNIVSLFIFGIISEMMMARTISFSFLDSYLIINLVVLFILIFVSLIIADTLTNTHLKIDKNKLLLEK